MVGIKYLLDTNILSEPLARQPSSHVLEKIKTNSAFLALASVTWQEFLYGMYLLPTGKRRDRIEDYLFRRILPALPILAFDASAAQWQAKQRGRLRQMGKSPAYPDSQIAAIAAVNSLVLVTRNTRDFADFEGLRMQNWFAIESKD
jgi:tRNA(fMet)-specific endonuclease VapC